MKQVLDDFKEEIVFNCWCNTGLIASPNSVRINSELEANYEIKEIKTSLLNVLKLHFYSTINELMILD